MSPSDARHPARSTTGQTDRPGDFAPRPDARVARRVEELLREQLQEMGINPSLLQPHEIAAHMTCRIAPDNSMTYSWKNQAILSIVPEVDSGPDETIVRWRMFTQDDLADDKAGDNNPD